MSYLPPPSGEPRGDNDPTYGVPEVPSAPSPYGSPPSAAPFDATPFDAAPTGSPYGTPPVADVPQPGQYGSPPPSPFAAPGPYVAPSPYGGGYTGAQYQLAQSTADNKLAVWALVLALVGLICGGLTAIVGLVLAIQARKAADAGRATNRGMATAAMVIAIVVLAFWALGTLANLANN